MASVAVGNQFLPLRLVRCILQRGGHDAEIFGIPVGADIENSVGVVYIVLMAGFAWQDVLKI